MDLAFDEGTGWVLTLSRDGSARASRLPAPRRQVGLEAWSTADGEGNYVYCSPSGQWLINGGYRSYTLWRVSRERPRLTHVLHRERRARADIPQFSPDERWLLECPWSGPAALLRLGDTSAEGTTETEIEGDVSLLQRLGSADEVAFAGFSPDGHWLAIPNNGGVDLWSLAAGGNPTRRTRVPGSGQSVLGIFWPAASEFVVIGEHELVTVEISPQETARVARRVPAPTDWRLLGATPSGIGAGLLVGAMTEQGMAVLRYSHGKEPSRAWEEPWMQSASGSVGGTLSTRGWLLAQVPEGMRLYREPLLSSKDDSLALPGEGPGYGPPMFEWEGRWLATYRVSTGSQVARICFRWLPTQGLPGEPVELLEASPLAVVRGSAVAGSIAVVRAASELHAWNLLLDARDRRPAVIAIDLQDVGSDTVANGSDLAFTLSRDGLLRCHPLAIDDLLSDCRELCGRNLNEVEWGLAFGSTSYRATFPMLSSAPPNARGPAGPRTLISQRWNSNEAAIVATLRNLLSAQAQLASSALCDVDGDGVGEYGGFLELSGGTAGRLAHPLNPPVLSGAFQHLEAPGVILRNGYCFQLFLPGRDGHGVAEPEGGFSRVSALDADLCETTWCAYAWPENYGFTGTRAFFVNQSGDILSTDDGQYSGRDAPPPADAAFGQAGAGRITGIHAAGSYGCDGNYWRPER